MCPCRAFHVFFFFFAENVGYLKTQISQRKQNPKYLAKKKAFVKGSSGAHLTTNVCKLSGSQKRRGHRNLASRNLGFYALKFELAY